MKKSDVTAETLANYIVGLADDRKATATEVEFVAANIDKFQFDVTVSFATKRDEIDMTRAQLDDNCDLLNL